MDDILHKKIEDLVVQKKNENDKYEYYKRNFLSKGMAKQCAVAVYEIPPLKSAYPYHFHTQNEEVFYIISGTGTLKTPSGERIVKAGELLFFSATANGAHKLTNNSDTENLVYLDFDTFNEIDVACYPDSGKIAIWGKNINKVYKVDDDVDYYDGE